MVGSVSRYLIPCCRHDRSYEGPRSMVGPISSAIRAIFSSIRHARAERLRAVAARGFMFSRTAACSIPTVVRAGSLRRTRCRSAAPPLTAALGWIIQRISAPSFLSARFGDRVEELRSARAQRIVRTVSATPCSARLGEGSAPDFLSAANLTRPDTAHARCCSLRFDESLCRIRW